MFLVTAHRPRQPWAIGKRRVKITEIGIARVEVGDDRPIAVEFFGRRRNWRHPSCCRTLGSVLAAGHIGRVKAMPFAGLSFTYFTPNVAGTSADPGAGADQRGGGVAAPCRDGSA